MKIGTWTEIGKDEDEVLRNVKLREDGRGKISTGNNRIRISDRETDGASPEKRHSESQISFRCEKKNVSAIITIAVVM